MYELKNKLLAGFITLAILSGIIGYIGITKIHEIDDADTMMYESAVVPISQLSELSEYFQRLRVNARDMVLADNIDDANKKYKRFMVINSIYDSIMVEYEKTIITEAGHVTFKNLKEAKAEYIALMPNYKNLVFAGKIIEAKQYLISPWGEVNQKLQKATDEIVNQKKAFGKKIADDNTAIADNASVLMIIMIILGVL